MNRPDSVCDLLSAYPVIIDIPVAWGEMDAFQHVNNVAYFRYFESARLEYVTRVGYTALMERTGAGPILASTRCRFRLPLSYPDTISVGARVSDIEPDRFVMEYIVVSHSQAGVAAEGDGLIVSFDYKSNKKVPLPDSVVTAIREIESTKG